MASRVPHVNNDESCRLLLVEDSRGDAMVIQALIAEAGRRSGTHYTVDHVESYGAALQRLSEAMLPYHVALLDLGLPDSDGIGTVGDLAERFPSLAVVVLTALDDADTAIDAVASGAQEYLPKGKVRPDELARVLRHAILRHRMEQTLRESESEHRALFEFNPHPIWVCHRGSLRVLAANEAAVRHYGWSVEQFLAMRLSDLTPTDQLGDLLDYLQGGPTQYGERIWRHSTRSGVELLVQLAAHPIAFYAQPAVLVMARNVTESTRLAHALMVSEQRFDALFEVSPGLLFEHDIDGCIVRINLAAANALGYKPESLVGLHLRQLMPTYAVGSVDRYLEALQTYSAFDGPLPLLARDLKRRNYRLRSRCFDASGQVRVLVVAEEASESAAAG
jgi:PAS domain S-box-containing protein